MNEFGIIILGIVIVCGLHILVISISLIWSIIFDAFNIHIFDNVFVVEFFAIGICQIIYIIPTIIILKRQNQIALMKGVIIGAVITALLNGGCWLLLFHLPVRH